MNVKDTIEFDEVEANALYRSVRETLKSTKWDPTEHSDWENLKSYRSVLDRLIAFLDGTIE